MWITPYCSSISLATSGPDSSQGLAPSPTAQPSANSVSSKGLAPSPTPQPSANSVSSQGLAPSPTPQPSATSVSSQGLAPSPTAQPSSTPVGSNPSTSTSTPTRPESTPTASPQPSQLIIIVMAVAATTVLLLVVVVVVMVGLVVIMVTVVCRRRSKEHVDENNNTDRSVRVQMRSNSLQSTAYYEPVSVDRGSFISHNPFTYPTSTHQILVMTSQWKTAPPTKAWKWTPQENTLTSDYWHYTIKVHINS